MAVYLGSNKVCTKGGIKNVTGGVSLQNKTVTPSESTQIVKADSTYDGLDTVTVNAISSTYIGSDITQKSAATYTPSNTTQTISSGQYLSGNQTISPVPTETKSITSNGTYSPTSGKYFSEVTVNVPTESGSGTVSLQSKTVSPTESSQNVTPDSGYDGLSSVTVNAISNTYVGSGVNTKGATTYTPGTSNQTIASGTYLTGTQTITGDSNLISSNIKSGASIFGVSGNYTSDATATSSDILNSKTAYVNGSKITGTIASQEAQTITPSTSDQTIASGKYLSGTQTIKGDSNLIAGNIKSGVSIFGIAGTYTGSSSSGSSMAMKSGTTTSATIDTGLSSISVFVIYKNSLTATGLIQGVYVTNEDTLYYTYCSYYSTWSKTCATGTSTASSVSGGTFTLGTSGTSGLSSSTTYNWIAFGET